MRHLGARLSHVGPGRLHIVLPARPEVTQQHGYVHAGAISAIADSAGGYAAVTLFPEDTAVLTVEYEINLLAPAECDHIEAVGTVLRSGRTLTACQLEVFGVRGTQRSLVTVGQQTLIRVEGALSSEGFALWVRGFGGFCRWWVLASKHDRRAGTRAGRRGAGS